MTQGIEQYIDNLLHDPHAAPPHEMDAGTAAFVRAMVAAGNAKPPALVRARMWQKALDATEPGNGTQNHLATLMHSTNGHHASLAVLGVPFATQPISNAPISSRFRGVLTLAAACALVLFGIVLLAIIGNPDGMPNSTGADQNSGTATPTETPTPLASGTPIPTAAAPSELARDVVEYTIQPGDTLLSIIQRVPYSVSDLQIVETISRLNPYVDMSRLSPGMTIRIPIPTPEPIPIATIPGTRLPSNLAAIMNDLQSLTGNADAGRVSFEAMACSACHDNTAISTLAETLWQSAEETIRRLPQFAGYTAEMYIVESIIHPSAYVVPGYTNLMPDTYRENLTLQQLADLIAYLNAFALPQRSQTSTPISATVVPTLPPTAESESLQPTVMPLELSASPIPRIATPIAVETLALTATLIVRQTTDGAVLESIPTAMPPEVMNYMIQAGDTLLGIAVRFDTTLQTLAELNPQLDFSTCDFTRFSGGSNCVIMLMVGETLNVPNYTDTTDSAPFLATPTPIPSSVFSLPTPTPA